MIVFDKLWETLQEKGISQYKLINEYGISAGQLSRLRSNANVNTHTIDVLCTVLNCDVSDVMEHVSDVITD